MNDVRDHKAMLKHNRKQIKRKELGQVQPGQLVVLPGVSVCALHRTRGVHCDTGHLPTGIYHCTLYMQITQNPQVEVLSLISSTHT